MSCDQPNTHALANSADDRFDPYQYRLYGRYCRVCSEAPDGICREGTRELAKQCQMSVGKVTSVRQWLKEQGYIATKEGAGDQPFETSILESPVSVHPMNTNAAGVQGMNESVSLHEQVGVHHLNDTVHEGEGVHPMNTKADESASHTGTGAVKQILKSQEIQEQEQGQGLKDKNGDGSEGANADARAKVFSQYEQLTGHGIDSLIVSQQLRADVEEFGQEWVDDSVAIAALNGVKNWNYVRSTLQTWRRDGKETSRPASVKGKFANTNGAHPARAAPVTSSPPSTNVGANVDEIRRKVQESRRLKQQQEGTKP